MKNIFKERVCIMAVLSVLVCAALSFWFYTRPGTQGLMTWQPSYGTLFRLLFCISLVPVVALIPRCICRNRLTKLISFVFSGIAAFAWIAIFAVLTIMSSQGKPSEKLNLLSVSDPLPVHSADKTDVSTPVMKIGFGSDLHYGATEQNTEACRSILAGLAAADNDVVFLLGDISEMGVLNYYPSAQADFEKYLGDVPLRVIPGNHDALVCSIPHFKKTFAQKGEPDYYRMDGGTVHILSLFILWDEHEFDSEQEQWLIQQLESIPEEDTVIVISHCYLYGSGTISKSTGKMWGDIPGVMAKICPILEKYHVDLAVSGHNHNFEYLENGGTSYCVIGTMGGKLDEVICYSSPKSKWTDFNSYGWLEATVYTDRIELSFLDVNGSPLYQETVPTR